MGMSSGSPSNSARSIPTVRARPRCSNDLLGTAEGCSVRLVIASNVAARQGPSAVLPHYPARLWPGPPTRRTMDSWASTTRTRATSPNRRGRRWMPRRPARSRPGCGRRWTTSAVHAVLAARVRDAHTARVWTPLGYPSWEAYCDAEFGISRAQAYRLLDVARALGAIQAAVDVGTEPSRARDTAPPPRPRSTTACPSAPCWPPPAVPAMSRSLTPPLRRTRPQRPSDPRIRRRPRGGPPGRP